MLLVEQFVQENIRSLKTDLHPERETVEPGCGLPHCMNMLQKFTHTPLFTAGATASMINDLNFSTFKSSILNS